MLLWLLVLAASESSRVFYASFAFSAVDPSRSGTGGASSAAANHHQSAAIWNFEHSLARVQPLLERYGYGAAFAAVMADHERQADAQVAAALDRAGIPPRSEATATIASFLRALARSADAWAVLALAKSVEKSDARR